MLSPGNTSPCHHSLHLVAKTAESQHAGIAQQLSDRALRPKSVNDKACLGSGAIDITGII
ncbi:hypothetical protein EWH12_21855 [Sphingobium cupriresistens]|uniref:Uncharacterized protein n=1 Tax=Sphingobium cupriresistens TaxID=1132417 RepID=A0A8G2DXG0_9SPHN|nr:hypothetical protein EWH12_21855 [Sphingobium cupriresistens]